ncbi:MAG: AAA family ATPase [Bacteroidota bacterium]
MIRKVSIKNFKSVQSLDIELGRFNVFIGANGSGKSNILEAIAFGSAAAGRKLDNEFLGSRGIRVSEPNFMRSAFDKRIKEDFIKLQFESGLKHLLEFGFENENGPYSKWHEREGSLDAFLGGLSSYKDLKTGIKNGEINIEDFNIQQMYIWESPGFLKLLQNFLIYSPEETALRNFHDDSQIEPLGINGAGLFKLLKVFSQIEEGKYLQELKSHLELIDWFEDFQVANGSFSSERFLEIKDQYLDSELSYFDQRSANEGFLFLLFYLALFISPDTPPFFAIDNIENALNPKLCSELVILLNTLSIKHDKQVICTTHSPSVLDGLNLNDDEQRLFVIDRNTLGHTKARRISKKPNQNSIKLSEAFIKGFIGGLPENF